MSFDPADPSYRVLLDEVLQSEAGPRMGVVPFVGSGLSVYGDPEQRLPLWPELLTRLIAEGERLGRIPKGGDSEIDALLGDHRYVEATDRIFEALGEPHFRRGVERELDDTGKPMPPAITQLVSVGWSLIVTTNLDRLIARAYLELHRHPIAAISNLDPHKLAEAVGGTFGSGEMALAQIHGDIDLYRSWCLTSAHYARLLKEPGYMQALRSLFLRRLFFVGFGMRDDDFDVLLETMASIYPPGVGRFYALIERRRQNDPEVQRLIERNGLDPIFYDVDPNPNASDPHGGYGAVFECLEHLAASWAKVRTDLDVTLKYFPELDPNIVGREREVERLVELIVAGGQVGQVVGLGGLGKTSLVQRFLMEKRGRIAAEGYSTVFGCSFYRADIGQFINDMALTMIGPEILSLPQQVDRICEHVRQSRTLLVLDGVEAIIDADGELRSPYLVQILESIVRGEGAGLVTSRVPVRGEGFANSPVVEVAPLSDDQITEFLDGWGLNRLGAAASRRLVEITAGHPLALRILAGVLRDVPAEDAVATIERSAVIDLSNEVDPRRENRLARILGSYFHHLDEAEIAFLDCSTVFETPAPYPLLEAAFTRVYPDTSVNEPLIGQDLRAVVGRLFERRLLTASTGGELTSHPTVREYFVRHVRETKRSLAPLHRYLAAEILSDAPQQPDSFKEAAPLIHACRHAAACKDWALFDDILRRRLMRGYRDYLCESLGAWEETLGLARLGDEPSFPEELKDNPGYYPVAVARSLKHLGRSTESRAKYLDSLKRIAPSADPDIAMYVNNFLTLLVWRGELAAADRLVELNVRAFSWIVEPWRHRWQVEHGFSSIAYLRLLEGRLDAASALFEHSERAWDGYAGERPWIYDYYPFYRSELMLLTDPDDYDAALAGIESLLTVAHDHRWPESICRGHIQAALVHLDRASRCCDPTELGEADRRLDQARQITAGMNVADVSIGHHLTRLKVELVRRELDPDEDLDAAAFADLIDRVEVLVSSSGLALAGPEVVAVKGALAYLQGSAERALDLYETAVRECLHQGNALAPDSPRSLVNWLGRQVGRHASVPVIGSVVDPIDLVGSDLSAEWMIERLEQLEPDGHTHVSSS